MAVSIAQQRGNQSTALNPSLAFQSRPTAGNYLLAVLLVRSANQPPVPTDGHNTWEPINATANNDNTIMLCAYRVRSALATNTTVQFTTDGASAFAIQELAGVPADVNPGTDSAIVQPDSSMGGMSPGLDHYVQATPGRAAEFCEAIIAAFGNVTFTNVDPSWNSPIAPIATANISMSLLAKTGGPGPQVAHWTTPTDQEVAILALSFG